MPSHTHTATTHASTASRGTTTDPTNNYWAAGGSYISSKGVNMASDAVENSSTGGGQSVNNMQPYLAINYIIALTGIFPSRN